ncbi:MAG TPA: S41 family peptidase [Candidatus Acidoferrum sp.]|nr:S41 family peptidase [Candidatus Acidoferrum sp.]
MSEKIYGWLLRLYPSPFREAYGEEALQLFRDRSREETGFLLRLRLWTDLLSDLAVSVPREYFHVQPGLATFSAHLRPEGLPSFFVFADEPLGPGALLFGGMLSIAALVTFSVLLNHGVRQVPLSALIRPTRSLPKASPSPFDSSTPNTAKNTGEEASESKAPPQLGTATTRSQPGKGAVGGTRSSVKLDATERRRIVDAAAAILEKHYVDQDSGRKMAAVLRTHEKKGDNDKSKDGAEFAARLTQQMREVSPDRHLTLDYFETPLPRNSAGPTQEDFARYREAMKRQNCTFEKVEILPHNIGYLKLNWFPAVSVCQATAEAAMASLNNVDAIIFDLRDNRGGEPAMVSRMAAYLFDHPEYLYNPRENTTEESWTHSPVPGNKLADKPVYLLTSARTFSGAEQFCYDLKMLKRATLVGETTGGGAHSGVFHRIDDHFGMGIPETKAINPYSKADWAEVGVEPHVKVKSDDALETALSLAAGQLQRNRRLQSWRD